MAAWFALTAGDYNRVITTSDASIEIAGHRSVSVQLAAQAAEAWARLANVHQAQVALDRGRSILETLPVPANPDDHFAIDPTTWHFDAMDVYRILRRDSLAQLYAEEVPRLGVTDTRVERTPCATPNAASPSL
jgi:hypothetical protein